jgi:hypothetical protein
MMSPVVSDYKSKESGPMEQTEKKTEGQKPKLCKLAILSPLVVIFGGLAGTSLALSFEQTSLLCYLGFLILLFSPLTGLGLGIFADWKIYKSKGMLRGRMFSILGTGLAIIVIIIGLMPTTPPGMAYKAYKYVCASNLAELGKSMQAYSDQYGQKYPTKDMWCDLLSEQADVNKITFICRGALKTGDDGPCHYAINPNCGPNSPPDTVLLFETKGGWNQYGGQELLTTEHHEDKGCNILFNNGDVKFIETNQLSGLKWGNEPKDEQK